MLDLGHNSAEILRRIVEDIEAKEAEIEPLKAEIADFYSEAKAMGLEVAILRKVIAERRKSEDEIERNDILLDLYREALGRKALRQSLT